MKIRKWNTNQNIPDKLDAFGCGPWCVGSDVPKIAELPTHELVLDHC
jgi:hypothetical protein